MLGAPGGKEGSRGQNPYVSRHYFLGKEKGGAQGMLTPQLLSLVDTHPRPSCGLPPTPPLWGQVFSKTTALQTQLKEQLPLASEMVSNL